MVEAGVLEAIAREIGEGTGCDEPPVDALRLAALVGFEVCAGRGRREGTTLFVPFGRCAETMLHWVCAHELAHGVLALEPAVENTEENASYLAAALLLPRRSFCADLHRTGWSLAQLHAIYSTAPPLAIARRIAECRDAIASVWTSGGRVRRRFAQDHVLTPRPLPLESTLAAGCWTHGTLDHERGSAQVVLGPRGGRRAIVVVDAEPT